jgi:uncharacterized membrane protein YphA (DoxX/SURF4 family)
MTLIAYGAQKVWPVQMPPPHPHQLLGELGSYTRNQLLWVSVGASPGYERFTGSMEVLAGTLLFVPQLATLAALLAILVMTQVLALNVFYDVQVKLFSFHLLLMALFLLLPDLRRLRDFLLNRATQAHEPSRLFRSARVAQIASGAQIVAGAIAVAAIVPFFHTAAEALNDTSRVPYYGVWDVDDFSLDGLSHPPLVSDDARWQRLIFDEFGTASIQRMNGAVIIVGRQWDSGHGTMTLTYRGDARSSTPAWKAVLHADSTSPDALQLQGQLNARPLSLRLRRSTMRFTLEPYETHWVLRERPDF